MRRGSGPRAADGPPAISEEPSTGADACIVAKAVASAELSAGLPVLTFDHRALVSFVETGELGLRLDGVEGLGARLRALDLPALRGRVAAARHNLTVERNIGVVLDLYDEIVRTGELVA